MKNFILALTLSLISNILFSAENTSLGTTSFTITKKNAVNSLFLAIEDIEGFLDNFTPVGSKITKPVISGNNIEFVVSKTILFITKKARFNADVSITRSTSFCPSSSTAGFELYLDLSKSEALITNNIENFVMDFCISENGPDKATLTTKSYLRKASTFDNVFMGNIIVTEISNQIPALIKALKIVTAKQN